MTDELDVLEPTAIAVVYLGERLEVRPLTVGQLPRLVRTAKPLIDAVLALDALPQDADAGLVTLLLELTDQHGEAAITAVAVATGKDAAWIARGNLAEFVELARAVVAANRDFFVQKLAPLLAGRAMTRNGGGKTASSC